MTTPQGPQQPRLTARQRRQRELAEISLRPALRPTRPTGAVVAMGAVLAVLWAIVAVDALLDHRLLRFGIKPRQLGGLDGVLLSPLLHANAGQLGTNTIPLAVFGWIMLISGVRSFALVTAACWLVSGLVSWAAAPAGTLVLGASGVIFGWLGYVLARAWFGRRLIWIGLAVAVLCVFSGMFTGLLPRSVTHTFWAGQLAGFLTGVLLAAVLHRRRRPATGAAASGMALPA